MATAFLSLNVTISYMIFVNAVIWVRNDFIIFAMLMSLVLGGITTAIRLGSQIDYYQIVYLLEG